MEKMHTQISVANHEETRHLTDFSSPVQFKYFTENNFESIPQVQALSDDIRFSIKVVASVLPFKVNEYVIRELINWDNIPDDPIFQLTFPQHGMLTERDFNTVADLIKAEASRSEIRAAANKIRLSLNPHPAGQMTLNVPVMDGHVLRGMQHKYRETVLFFPTSGQTCHAYCTFCFRWAQFVGLSDLKFAAKEGEILRDYVLRHPEVTNVLFTGGDPMVMKTSVLTRYIEPLLDERLENLQTIRIGTKALAYWPMRFVTDKDSDDLLRLFERIRKAGRQVAIMAHYNHFRELETPVAQEAIRRVLDTGAMIRTQSPVVAHINDQAVIWEEMWREQVRLGMVPYYMFVERDTGARDYFKVPLEQAHRIYRDAYKCVNGLSRTVRGPSMSATPGKVEVSGIAEVNGEKVFVLRFIQGRNPDWVDQPFFAQYDPNASWLNELTPAFGEEKFFFEDELEKIISTKTRMMETLAA